MSLCFNNLVSSNSNKTHRLFFLVNQYLPVDELFLFNIKKLHSLRDKRERMTPYFIAFKYFESRLNVITSNLQFPIIETEWKFSNIEEIGLDNAGKVKIYHP